MFPVTFRDFLPLVLCVVYSSALSFYLSPQIVCERKVMDMLPALEQLTTPGEDRAIGSDTVQAGASSHNSPYRNPEKGALMKGSWKL